MDTSLSFKEEFLQCPICMNEFENPKSLLPCQHTICRQCLKTYIEKSITKRNRQLGILCPICQQFIQIPNPKHPKKQWVDDFPNNFIFSSMLDSLRQTTTELPDVAQRCTSHSKPLRFYCRSHSCLVCQDCCSAGHTSCQVTTDRNVKKDFESTLDEIENILGLLRAMSENFTSDSKMREDRDEIMALVEDLYTNKSRLPKNQVLHMSKTTMTEKVSTMIYNEHSQIQRKREKCKSAIADAEAYLSQAKSRKNMSLTEICTITDVNNGMLELLKKQMKEVEVVPGFDQRMKMYIRSLLTPVFPGGPPSSEFEMKAIPFPAGSNLKFSKITSFDAKVQSDLRNCFITGTTVLSTDGRIILADQNNSKLKMFSETFSFLGELFLLAAPYDVAETESFKIAVTFGEKCVVHLYSVKDTLTSAHRSFSTEQPCYGISSGSGQIFVFCDNLILNPACIKVYDCNMNLSYKIPLELFSTSDYLDYCPVSRRLYLMSQFLAMRSIVCYTEEGSLVWKQHIPGDKLKGFVALPNGALVVSRPAFQLLNENKPVVYWVSSHLNPSSDTTSEKEAKMRKVLKWQDVGYVRTISSNKQRTVLVATQEMPLLSLARNNEVMVFKIQR